MSTMSEPTQTFVDLPLLDMSQPILTSSLSSLSQFCKDWGFFRITNHGISKELYTRLHALSNQVFDLPMDAKLKLGPSSSINTYTPPFIASPFFESLRVSGPNFFSSAKTTSDILHEATNTEFCDLLEEYGKKMTGLSKSIVTVLLSCLGGGGDGYGYETKHLESEFCRCHGYLRINSYLPHENAEAEEAEGLGMHTDMSCVTILYQDDVGGLQVRSREGRWMDVVPGEGALVVNVGDLMQAWSNARLRSSQHRVVLRRPVPRFSLAFFWCFEDEKVVSAPEGVVREGEGRMYRPFVCREYMKYRENCERGRFDKVGYTVDEFAAIRASM